jgi:hypothetical protein
MISVTVAAIDKHSARYTITIRNNSGDQLLDAVLDHSSLLHPGQFNGGGSDYTHMPYVPWVPEPVRFASLPSGDSVRFEVDGAGVPAAFKTDGVSYARLQFSRLRHEKTKPEAPEKVSIGVQFNLQLHTSG